ncbi:alpha/beta fold hydrolase, partial [Staphylococcus aureus]
PPRFRAEYAADMALRPTQIRATSEDGALMIQGALALREHYRTLNLPVAIIVGDRDRVVRTRQSTDLADNIPGSTLHIVPGAGHMVH